MNWIPRDERLPEHNNPVLVVMDAGHVSNPNHPGYPSGRWVTKEMEPFCTLEQVGAELGITKQNAYTETVVALGALGLALRARLLPPNT